MPIRTLTGAIRRRLNRQRCQYRSEHVHHSSQGEPACQLNKNVLRLLSFNIQVGINTQQYRHYLTRSWQHILPHSKRIATLDRIAGILPDFDLVALQEADGGSLRSGFINQTEYLALKGHFPYWYHQLNRNLGKLAQHSNGLLSRFEPLSLEDHKLPGLIPGRGAIVARFGNPREPLTVVMMHLALSKRARNIQLSYIRDVVQSYQHVVLMGDMNTHADQLLNDSPLKDTGLHAAHWGQNTFPSWQPKRSLDHILISPSLIVNQFGVINIPITDHLPVSVEIQIPDSVIT
ncbi:endonuclease/exonuclease/phosphatase family protein [Endozoicomonas sp.]|uniref:endonuclease/exonuclease/phosphatase family protein n=1 Tax=Endozoicomonas sp. TaxID=1892382 RepID=UPI0028845BCC|nr:endonuclease/exonuclease/phosphatase family protein [Endozoicomonas sp.]